MISLPRGVSFDGLALPRREATGFSLRKFCRAIPFEDVLELLAELPFASLCILFFSAAGLL